MSIYVYVTRRHKPFEDSPSIDASEWLEVSASDPSFRQPSAAEIEPARRTKSHYAVWTGHPEGLEAWFIWTNGQIDVKNPDEPMVVKAMAIARKLSAHVVSETGEIFNEDGSHKAFVDGKPW